MSEKKTKCELLAPAGSFDAARAAVNAGADAIYMGGPLFSARAYAESSKEDMLLSSIEFCHLRGVRVFMTLNTLVKEKEFTGLKEYLKSYAKAGLDGVIVQDLGVMRLIKEEFPCLELHISTQAAITGARYAGLLKSLGAKRIVLARELSLKEIKNIYDETGAELEVFCHGALCYSLSGQCLMSSFIGGRSGNRGRCAGTCRLPFDVYDDAGRLLSGKKEKYVLSMKDLNTAARLKEMLDAGVYSFKIEGRMKSPLYVAAVTSVYRKYLDIAMKLCDEGSTIDRTGCDSGKAAEGEYLVDMADIDMLSEVFERGGHTDGYLDHKNGRDMITLVEKKELRVRDESVIDEIKKKYLDDDKKVPVSAYAMIHIGMPPELTLMCNFGDEEISLSMSGDVNVEPAQKRPVTEEDIKEKLSKFGGTDFELSDIMVEMDVPETGCFIPVKTLNELRRKALEALRERLLAKAGKINNEF